VKRVWYLTEQSAAQIMQRPTSHHAMAHRSLHIAPAVRGVVFRGVRERHWRRGMRCDLYSVQGDPLSNVAHWPDVKGKTRALRQREPDRSRKNCATAGLIVSIVAAITANNWAAGAALTSVMRRIEVAFFQSRVFSAKGRSAVSHCTSSWPLDNYYFIYLCSTLNFFTCDL
jgi:hypothetical protein